MIFVYLLLFSFKIHLSFNNLLYNLVYIIFEDKKIFDLINLISNSHLNIMLSI